MNKFSIQIYDFNPNFSIENIYWWKPIYFRIEFWWNLILTFGKIKSIFLSPDAKYLAMETALGWQIFQ